MGKKIQKVSEGSQPTSIGGRRGETRGREERRNGLKMDPHHHA